MTRKETTIMTTRRIVALTRRAFSPAERGLSTPVCSPASAITIQRASSWGRTWRSQQFHPKNFLGWYKLIGFPSRPRYRSRISWRSAPIRREDVETPPDATMRRSSYRAAFCTKLKSKTWLGGTSLTAAPRVFWVNSMAPFIQFSSTEPSTDWRVQ